LVHSCYECNRDFVSFRDVIGHALREHRDILDERTAELFERALRREWRCSNCTHAGKIYYSELDEFAPLRKACPGAYFFNHPDPAGGCVNFWPRKWGRKVGEKR